MDVITAVIYLILFIILCIFIFSIGILTSKNSKKDILMVLGIAFLVGAIGGTFFISPMYGDFPDLAGDVYGVFSFEPETLVLVLDGSKDYNYTTLQKTLNETDGVQSVSVRSISVTTSNFTEAFADRIRYSLYNINSTYKNCSLDPANGVINITLEDDADPYGAVRSMADYLSLVSDTSPASTSVIVEVKVSANSINSVEDKLNNMDIGVTDVEGPVSDFVKYLEKNALSFNELVLVTGVIGVIVGLIGIFVDNIIHFKRKTTKKVSETYKGISEKRKSNDDELESSTNSTKKKKNNEDKPIIIKDIDEKSIGAKKDDKDINFVDDTKTESGELINEKAVNVSKLIDKPVNESQKDPFKDDSLVNKSHKDSFKDNSLVNKSITKNNNLKDTPVIKIDEEDISSETSKDSGDVSKSGSSETFKDSGEVSKSGSSETFKDSGEVSKSGSSETFKDSGDVSKSGDGEFLYPKPSKKTKK